MVQGNKEQAGGLLVEEGFEISRGPRLVKTSKHISIRLAHLMDQLHFFDLKVVSQSEGSLCYGGRGRLHVLTPWGISPLKEFNCCKPKTNEEFIVHNTM